MISERRIKSTLCYAALMTIFFLMVAVLNVSSTSLSDKVEIHCDGEIITVDRSSKSVYQVLTESGISLGIFDAVIPGIDVKVEDLDKIFVKRAVKVTLNEDGIKKEYETSTDTVKEFLDAKGISYNSYDLITPALDEVIEDGAEVTITRGERILTEVNEEIPYTTVEQPNAELPKNIVSITRYGVNGIKTKTVETIKVKGKVVSERVLSDVITKEPVSEILDVGTKENVVMAPDGTVYSYSKVITCTATAYDATFESNGYWGPVSATGKALDSGMVAVDPRVIPLGTKLYIEAPDGSWVYGYSVAEDTGGAIKGNKVDLFFHSPARVKQFGRRTANVYILD